MFIEFANELINVNCIEVVWKKITSDETDTVQYFWIVLSDYKDRDGFSLEPLTEILTEGFGANEKACDKRFVELKKLLTTKST